MYIEIYLYAENNRKKRKKNPPGRQPTTPGATYANQGGGSHAKGAAAGPTWRVPPPTWPTTSPIHVTPPGVHPRHPKPCLFDPRARTCCNMDHGFLTCDKIVLRQVSYQKPTLRDHVDHREQMQLPRGGAHRRSLAPARGEWHPPPHSCARHSSSLPCVLLTPEESLTYKRTPSSIDSNRGEKKRTQEEAQA
jgi:hypothetical protein